MQILLNDCSVLLNLLAGDCLPHIAQVTGWQFAICPAVRDEVKKLRDAQTGEMVEVDIAPLIASGLIQVLELADETEQTLYVEQSIAVDDGEAMSIAIAGNRNLELAIDDKQARNHASRAFPGMRFWTTPEILKRWVEFGQVDAEMLRAIIRLIEIRARYFPPRTHPLAHWWQAAKSSS